MDGIAVAVLILAALTLLITMITAEKTQKLDWKPTRGGNQKFLIFYWHKTKKVEEGKQLEKNVYPKNTRWYIGQMWKYRFNSNRLNNKTDSTSRFNGVTF